MAATQMRAVKVLAPLQVELVEEQLEDVNHDTALRGPTVASVISPGTEISGLRGMFGSRRGVTFPFGTGYAAVFRVTEVGPAVEDVEPGQHVFCFGPHQSFQQVRRDEAVVVPDSLAPEVAPFARLMAVTMSTLVTTRARPPETVLVSGLGIIGNLAAQIFGAAGYTTLAWNPGARRREIAERCGIRTLDRPFSESSPLTADAALALECSGNEAAALDCISCVKRNGEVVLVARPWQQQTGISAHALLERIYESYAIVRSGWEWQLPLHPEPFRSPSTYDLLASALRWLDEGRVVVDDVADRVPPENAPEVYARLERGEHDYLTSVFRWE
jgi:threonine dehydrogenase-like Zn-dependent dehydrogenase